MFNVVQCSSMNLTFSSSPGGTPPLGPLSFPSGSANLDQFPHFLVQWDFSSFHSLSLGPALDLGIPPRSPGSWCLENILTQAVPNDWIFTVSQGCGWETENLCTFKQESQKMVRACRSLQVKYNISGFDLVSLIFPQISFLAHWRAQISVLA